MMLRVNTKTLWVMRQALNISILLNVCRYQPQADLWNIKCLWRFSEASLMNRLLTASAYPEPQGVSSLWGHAWNDNGGPVYGLNFNTWPHNHPVSMKGDSGSWILNSEGDFIGLLWGELEYDPTRRFKCVICHTYWSRDRGHRKRDQMGHGAPMIWCWQDFLR